MTHPEPNDGPTLILMACRPADPNSFPEGPLRDNLAMLAPLDPGYSTRSCENCGMAVLMGPRQRTQYEADPSSFLIADFLCAVRISTTFQGADKPVSVEHLGGR